MGTEIDRLEIAVQAEASKAVGQIDKLISKLNQVSSTLTATNTSGLRNFASGIKQLSSAMQNMSGVKATDFNRLASGIEKLSTINESALYKSANGIRNFTNSLNGIGSVSDDAVKIGDIARNVSRLGNASMQRLTTTLPQLSIALKEFMTTLSTSPNVSDNIIKMTNAMASLASNGSKFSSTINGLSRAARTLTRSNSEVVSSNGLLGKSFSSARVSAASFMSKLTSLAAIYYAIRQAADFVGESIKKSMDFTETINLFQTSYKKIGEEAAVKNGMAWGSKSADAYAKAFIDRAQTFNDKLVNALGLDPNTMMNYQAVFAQISSAMGLTANTAENISESFTMLGNDIASLWNLNTKDAMEKLQAGLTGQVRPLRELGVDITQATLQLTAYKYGVKESVKDMSQAEKVQLRWLTIMDQSSVAFGDMAKTINSPANQLRILKQQWDNLSRSIGNVFMPIVTTVLPYINAVVIALRNMIDTLATALGYELPDYTDSNIYSDVTGGIGGVTDATDKATKANEKYKKSIMGIDELNILSKPASSSSDSGSAKTGSGNSKLDDAINEKTASYMKKFNEELEKMSNKSKDIAKGIENFFALFAKNAEPSIKALKKLWDEGLSKFAGFIAKGVIDFYKKFLEPVGKWVLGKGIPGLADALNNLLTAIDWDALNDALGGLFDALAKMTKGIGQGLVDFIVDLSKSLKPAIGTTSKLLADSIKAIASSLNNVDAKTWEDAGRAIGVIATALGGMKIVTGLPAFLLSVGSGLETLAMGLSNFAYMNPVALPALFDVLGLDDWLDELYYELPQWCRDVWEGIWYGLASILNDVFNFDKTMALIEEMKANFKSAFDGSKKKWYEIGQSILYGIIDGIAVPFSVILEPINDLFLGLIKAIKDVFDIHSPSKKMKPYGNYITQGLLKGIIEGWEKKWDEFKTWLSGLPEKIATGFGSLTGLFATKGKSIIEGIETGWTKGSKAFEKWLSLLPSDISEWFGSLVKDFTKKGQQIIDGIEGGWIKGNKAFKKWLSSIPGEIADGIGSLFNIGKNLIQTLVDGIKSVHIDLPHLKITGSFDLTKGKIPTVGIDWYATGGFPEDGLFMANHNELVGQFANGKTAVANNLQIQAGIEEAAYRGYARAIMDFGGNNQSSTDRIIVESNLYVDSEKMYGINQKGKAKYERRNQTALNPT